MKRTFLFTACFLLFCPPLFAQKSYTGQTIEEILALPEDQIDLGIACLVLAKDFYPNLNINNFDYVLDYMANRVNTLMQGNTDPLARISLMNTYLYRPGWWNDSVTFTYDLDDLEVKKTENQFLNGYLATKKGSCTTMPMLYMVLADRLGWPIHAVRSVQHSFCRYIDDGLKENNIEATGGGGYNPDEIYISDGQIPEKAIKNGVYLRTLSKKEYIANLLGSNALKFYLQERNLAKAIHYSQLGLAIDTTHSGMHWNLGNYYFVLAKKLEKEMLAEMQVAREANEIESLAMQRAATHPLPSSTPQSPFYGIRLPEPPQPSLMPPHLKPPSLFPQQPPTPIPHVNTPIQNNPLVQNQYLQLDLAAIQVQYAPLIKNALAKSEWHKAKANELGIVFDLSVEFFKRQAKSIEEFKRTGKY